MRQALRAAAPMHRGPIQARKPRCRFGDVSISPQSASAADQARLEDNRQIAVMKKAGDVQKDTAQALVDLVKQAPQMPAHVGTRINVVA